MDNRRDSTNSSVIQMHFDVQCFCVKHLRDSVVVEHFAVGLGPPGSDSHESLPHS